ncbi:SAF domain-containing protein [Pseudoclostridium thermosuccinogenes]|uniref:Flp pilus assembly protein CpaB n=1 Tax=Clostridium thermosuccinogenes TaxID=84032 RepID=UPI002FDB80B3
MKRLYMALIVAVAIVALVATEVVIIRSLSNFEPKIPVVYAKRQILPQDEITADMVEIKNVNISYVHKLAVRRMEDVVGQKARVAIESGEMILSSRIGYVDDIPAIELKKTENRLFTVEFKPDQANGWWLLVDQYVDILYVPDEEPTIVVAQASAPQYSQNQARHGYDESKVVRLSNIRVAAIIDERGNLLSNGKRDIVPRYVSFEVDDKQDAFLAYAKSHGRLEISVRPSRK